MFLFKKKHLISNSGYTDTKPMEKITCSSCKMIIDKTDSIRCPRCNNLIIRHKCNGCGRCCL